MIKLVGIANLQSADCINYCMLRLKASSTLYNSMPDLNILTWNGSQIPLFIVVLNHSFKQEKFD